MVALSEISNNVKEAWIWLQFAYGKEFIWNHNLHVAVILKYWKWDVER